MENKKKSYRQLEKHLENGRALIMRVTKQLTAQKEATDFYKAQLESAKLFIAALIPETATITKEQLKVILSTKAVTWQETEDKTAYTIMVKDKPVE